MKTKFNPENHIIGKVYDLTQENMQTMLNHIDKLESENAQLRKALQKYADSETHSMDPWSGDYFDSV